jgi:hypothetical protein
MSEYFTSKELECKCGCKLLKFPSGWLEKLDLLRAEFDQPMTPTSACRCLKHNMKVSSLAPRTSLHIGDFETRPGHKGCLAIDIACPNAVYKGKLFALAWKHGWSIGWNKAFLHLDRRIDIGMPQTTFEY